MFNKKVNNKPKVTIVTTVWNLYEKGRVETFRQMMESVHNQTYPNLEHIVINNNSTDETKDLIQEYVDKGYIANTYFEEKQGLWHGMNRGIEEATGEFINFMNSDDYFYCDDAVEASINAILKAGADWSYGYSNKINPETNEIIFKWYFDDYACIYNQRCPNHQTLFVRTSLLREQGGFEINEKFPKGAFSDDLSMMRLLFSGHIPVVVPKVLVVYRDGGTTANVGRQGAKHYVERMRREFGFYEMSEKELDAIYWESNIKKLSEPAFERLLNKIPIPDWRKRLVKVYGKDFSEAKIPKSHSCTENPKISIIVPVFNAECYIRAGIYSLMNQTLEDIEILCINDGSTDHTLDILNELQAIDSRVKVFNQENKGPATARNVGLKNAHGKYIMFLDADDTYCPNMCEEMCKAIESRSVDVVMCDTNTIGTNYGNWPFPFGKGTFEIDCNIRKKINCWLWNKIFKSEIIKQNKINFPDGHKSDDDFFTAAYFMYAKQIHCLDKKLVNHFRCENSIMHCYNSCNPNKNDIFDRIYILERIAERAKKSLSTENNEYIDYMRYKFKEQVYYAWLNIGREIETEFLDALRECIKTIGTECVPENSLLNAIMQKQDKIAVNLMDCFAEQFTNTKRKKYLFQKKLEPVFNKDYVPVVFSANNNYCKYLSVALQSVIESSSPDKNYDIIVLENDISDENKKILTAQIPNNFSIRFYNITPIIEKYNVETWFYTGRLNTNAYSRLFIPEILQGYKKCVYLDVDLVVQKDIYELYQNDVNGCFLGAVRDILQTSSDKQEYFKTHLEMKNPENNYFNSGVLLFNLEEIKQQDLMRRFLFFAQINNKFYHDQNILNAACEGRVKYLSPKWNMITSSVYYKDYKCTPYQAPFESFTENINIFLNNEDINILHFATWTKPWHNVYIPMANIWWKYARKSPYYEKLIFDLTNGQIMSSKNAMNDKERNFFRLLKLMNNKNKIKRNYYRCKILSKITFGKTRTHYKQKRKMLKEQIREIRNYI